MRWIGTGHQVPSASTTARAHGVSGLIARRAATASAKAATACVTSSSVVVWREREQHRRVGPGRLQPDRLERRRRLAAVERCTPSPGETATPRAASASASASPSTQPGRHLDVARDAPVARARSGARRAPRAGPAVRRRGQGAHARGPRVHLRPGDLAPPRRAPTMPGSVLGARRACRPPAGRRSIRGCSRAPGRTSRAPVQGGAPTGPPPTTTRVGVPSRGVHRHQPGRLAGVDQRPARPGRAARTAATQRGDVLQRPDVGLAVHERRPGRCRRARRRRGRPGRCAPPRRRPPGRGARPRRGRRCGRPPGSPGARRRSPRRGGRARGWPDSSPFTARLRASVAPEVKITQSGSAARQARRPGRARRSSASAGARPQSWRLDGLPNALAQRTAASPPARAGRAGMAAAWSR